MYYHLTGYSFNPLGRLDPLNVAASGSACSRRPCQQLEALFGIGYAYSSLLPQLPILELPSEST